MGNKRTPESEDRIFEMVKMRASGNTFQQIADNYGISRQCVQQTIADFIGYKRKVGVKPCAIYDTIYPNLGKWMIESGTSMIKLSRICGLNTKNCDNIRYKLLGERQFKISEIKAILKESGEAFEYLFTEKAVDCETK